MSSGVYKTVHRCFWGFSFCCSENGLGVKDCQRFASFRVCGELSALLSDGRFQTALCEIWGYRYLCCSSVVTCIGEC